MSDNKLKLIQDIELDNLNDENDFLETRKYSDTLQEIIKTTHTPCTIGLFGEWGSGKSSIIRDVINELDFNKNKGRCKDTNEKIRFVVYDAWKYSKDSFRRTFLLEVAKELKLNYVRENDRFYTSKTQDLKISQKFNWKYLGMFLLFFIIVWVVFVFLEKIGLLLLGDLSKVAIIAFLSFIATFSKNILSDYKTTIQEPLMFAPEQFENEFNNMHSIVFEKYNVDNEPFPPILHEINIDKLVIVVDNLDRCNADTVCEMLSDIKGFLNKDKVVFIVPLDDKMLKKHLAKNNDYEDSESSEYLRKIFDCVLSLKKTQEFDMYEVLYQLLKNHKIEYNPNTMGVIAEEYASNPRRIIKFVNNFEIEKELLYKKGVGEDFIKTNETLIAFLLVLKEEQFSLYQKILENISNIHTIGDGSGKEDENDENQSENIKTESIENIYMKKFLEHTKIIWSKADLNVVDKVVCNLNTEDKLPYEIREKLEKNEFNEIKQEKYAEVLKHLVFGFNKWCEREAYETKALSFFKQLIKANAYKMLSKNHFDDIYNKSKDAIQELLEYLEDEEDIKNAILFIKSSKNQEYVANYKKSLIDNYSFVYKETNENGFSVKNVFKIDNEDKNKYCEISEIYKLGFEYFLNNQMYSQEDLGLYQEYFYTNLYFNDYKPYLNLNDEVLKSIIGESIIDKLLQTKIKNRSDLHKLMQRLLKIEMINHSQYCKSIFNIEDVNSVRKLLTFRKFVKNNQSKNITLDGYTHLCVNCIKDCKKTSKEMLEFFIDYFNEDKNLYIIINNILEQERIFEKQSECIKYCLSRDKKLNINIMGCFEKILLANKSNSVSINILKDMYIKLLSTYNDSWIRSTIEYRMQDIIQNIDSDIGKNMQNMLIDLANNQELSKIVIDTVRNYKKQLDKQRHSIILKEERKQYAKLTPEFKETFFKGEAL